MGSEKNEGGKVLDDTMASSSRSTMGESWIARVGIGQYAEEEETTVMEQPSSSLMTGSAESCPCRIQNF